MNSVPSYLHRMKPRRSFAESFHVLLPALGALVAALGLVGLHAWSSLNDAEKGLEHTLRARADAAADALLEMLEREKLALGQVRIQDLASCGVELRDQLRLLPTFADLHLLDATGRTICSARGLDPEGAGLVRGRDVGVPVAVAAPGLAGGADWVVPMQDASRWVRGLLRVDAIAGLITAVAGTDDELLVLSDTTGVVVARSIDTGRWVGRPTGDDGPVPRSPELSAAGPTVHRGPGDVERYWTFSNVEGLPWRVGVAVPTAPFLVPIREGAFRQTIFALALLILMGLALMGSRRRFEGFRLRERESELAWAEAELREIRERFRLVLRASRDLIWDWDVVTGRVYRNRALRRLLGETPIEEGEVGSRSDGLGRAPDDAVTTQSSASSLERWLARVPEPDRTLVRGRLQEILEGADTTWTLEYPMYVADGRLLRVRDRGYVVRDPDGRPLRMVGVASDITDEKRRIEEVRRSKERYESVIRSAPFGFFLARTDGQLLEWNRALERIVGSNWNREDPPPIPSLFASSHTFHRLVEEARGGSNVVGREVAWLRRDGSELAVRLTLNPFRDPDQPTVEGVVENITEHRRLEEQARHAQKMEAVGRLAGGVAHDFNNLLTVISGEARILLSNPSLDPDTRESLEAVLEAGTRGSTLTRQLLTVSRRQVVRPVPVQVNDVVIRVEAMITRLLGENVRVSHQLAPDLPRAQAAEGDLEQILLNLTLNARDALPPKGGHIEIRTRTRILRALEAARHPGLVPGEYVVLTVEDDGEGIDPRILSRIFEPFFTTKGAGKGTGLGLSMVYGMVTRVGGAVDIASRPGEGTSFHVYLPVAGDTPESSTAEPAPALVDNEAGGRVVLVEDEEAVRRMAFRVLERAGYDVVTFAHPAEALTWFRDPSNRVDLLVTDVRMPGMDGNALADRVREVRPALPVLYVSGYPEEATIGDRVKERDAAFIAKPFSPEGLLEAARTLLRTAPPVPR
jgi:two-component system, cell cycle sensor histidine kinase and response regulator CckA